MKTSAALSLTGMVWAYYGLLVRPKALLLVAVNVALLAVNGTNLVRKYRYDAEARSTLLEESEAPSEDAVASAVLTVVDNSHKDNLISEAVEIEVVSPESAIPTIVVSEGEFPASSPSPISPSTPI